MLMPRGCSRRIPRNLKRHKRRKGRASSSSSEPTMTAMSPLELFFPIPESLIQMSTRPAAKQKKKSVSFETEVQVVEIESHRNYSAEVKECIWEASMQEIVQRNRLEVFLESQAEWLEEESGWSADSSELDDCTEQDEENSKFIPIIPISQE